MSKKYSEDAVTTRAFSTRFTASEDEVGVIEGVPIVFNADAKIKDWAGEFIERVDAHALDNTDMRDVHLFVNHDTSQITLARTKNGNGTMQLSIQPDGVHMRAELDIENNTHARALYSAVKRGDMDGMSFMFRVRGDKWDNIESDCPIRTITDISIIHEVSVVNFPAYPQTSVNARDAEETASVLEEARARYAEETVRDDLEMEKLKTISRIKILRRS